MSQEAHAQFCERLGVRLPEASYRVITCKSAGEAQSALHQAIRERGHFGNSPGWTALMRTPLQAIADVNFND